MVRPNGSTIGPSNACSELLNPFIHPLPFLRMLARHQPRRPLAYNVGRLQRTHNLRLAPEVSARGRAVPIGEGRPVEAAAVFGFVQACGPAWEAGRLAKVPQRPGWDRQRWERPR